MSSVIVAVESERWCQGEEVVRLCAERLGYASVDAEALCQDTAARHHLRPDSVAQALLSAPSFLGIKANQRRRQIAYFHTTLLEKVRPGSIIYHGPFGSLFLAGIAHVVRVHLTADLTTRLAAAGSESQLTEAQARRAIRREANYLRRWPEAFWPLSSLPEHPYDLRIDTSALAAAQAAEQIVEATGQRRFRPTTYSRGRLQQLADEASMRAALIHLDPRVRVHVTQEGVKVQTVMASGKASRRVAQIKKVLAEIEAGRDAEVQVIQDRMSQLAGSLR